MFDYTTSVCMIIGGLFNLNCSLILDFDIEQQVKQVKMIWTAEALCLSGTVNDLILDLLTRQPR